MKFRKKPVVVEAVEFKAFGTEGFIPGPDSWMFQSMDGYWYIRTLEGDMRVSKGDFIITGVRGEKYPCKPDIFEMTYDPVK